MKIIIAGSRLFDDYEFLEEKCDKITCKLKEVIVMTMGAPGAEKLGQFWAWKRKYTVEVYHPDHKLYKKNAGDTALQDMLDQAKLMIAFWDGISKGTEHVIEVAKENSLDVRVFKWKGCGLADYNRKTNPWRCET